MTTISRKRPDVKHTTSGDDGPELQCVEQFGQFAIARVPAHILTIGHHKVAISENWLLGEIVECKVDASNELPLLATATAFFFDWHWSASEARVRDALDRCIKAGKLVYG